MSPARAGGKRLDEILATLSHLKGVRHAFYIGGKQRAVLGRIERSYPAIGPLTVHNDGVMECLKRKHVACIIKDKSFRAPPHSTVLLVDGDGQVIGRELLPGEKVKKRPSEKVVFLGDDFVLFAGRGSGKGARFVLPGVPFKEVEELDGVVNVVSASPSTVGDLHLRKSEGLDDDPKLASILVGFHLRRL